ncbi:hypothetical protein DPMN_144929 [Dreissena polymorpha]|uniref:Uncharacterized protein n=1 Tax=Dreissena polymorpha TaxID=45954 RepID=A0A9D4F5Q6_DREPO|nr:hypothetical protein DPMN_144929 [Dreissena polymorpha]
MAYLRRWRKCHAEAAAIALASSSSEDEAPDVQVEERRDTERESTSHCSDNHAVTTDSDSSDNGDVVFSFSDTVESSDSASSMSEREDKKSFREKIASWATKNNMRKSSVDEILKILRDEEHEELPKDAKSLLKTHKNVECEERCGGKCVYFEIRSGVEFFFN